MINREATIHWKGYDPVDLTHGSDRKVWANCELCGKGRWVIRGRYRELCGSCARKKYLFPINPKFVKEENRFIFGTGIDRIETIRVMGYDPIDLKSKSVRKVCRICRNCGDVRWVFHSSATNLCHDCTVKTEKYKQNMSELLSGCKNPNWRGGIMYGKYCEKFNFAFKEMIRALFGRRCFLCGITEEENGKRLDVHHVNYDKDCLCNSGCEFVPLCRSCHTKTNFRRKYWEDLIMCYLYPYRVTMIDL